jgi:exopolysaccharide biosynthesis polyprenyl glycosylphosphotransferase
MRVQQRVVRDSAATVSWLFDDVFALALMMVTFTIANAGRLTVGVDELLAARVSLKNVLLAGLFMAIWHVCSSAFGLYVSHPARSMADMSVRIVAARTTAAAALTAFIPASTTGAFGLRVVIYFWLLSTIVALIGHTAIALGARFAEWRAHEVRHVVIIGSGPLARRLCESIEARSRRDYVVVGFVDSRDPSDMAPGIRERVIGRLEDFEQLVSQRPIDQVLIALPVKSHYAAIQDVIEACERVGVEAKYFNHFFAVSKAKHAIDDEGDGLAGVRLQLVVDDHRLIIKRTIDVVGATLALVVLSPVLIACAVIVKLSSPGPVLYSQLRYGKNRRLFNMYKLRTMVQDAERLQSSLEAHNEASGPVFKIKRDPRVTPVGRWLRRLSLDELPQLFQVLQGHMSLVGPRPLPMRDVSQFNATWLLRRFSVKPGLTCLWQVNGRSNVDFENWVRLDLDYIDNWSLSLDMVILLKTVPAVLSGSGAM